MTIMPDPCIYANLCALSEVDWMGLRNVSSFVRIAPLSNCYYFFSFISFRNSFRFETRTLRPIGRAGARIRPAGKAPASCARLVSSVEKELGSDSANQGIP